MSDSGAGDYLWRLKSCLDDTACLDGLGPLPCRVLSSSLPPITILLRPLSKHWILMTSSPYG